jgi:hypothetical protein
VTNVNRSLPGKNILRSAKARAHVMTAAAALAFIAGLAAPASAAFADTPKTTEPAAATIAAQATHSIGVKTAAAPQPVSWANTAPSAKDLFPEGKATGQSTITLSDQQLRNARAIVQAGQKMNLPPRAWVIALSTSLQESKLQNLGDLGSANDHDSLGLFQQRPASGWGTPQEINDPTYAATAFYKALVQVPGWQNMAATDAAQAVQVSAFGDAYAQWEQQAGDIVSGLYGSGPYAAAHNLK